VDQARATNARRGTWRTVDSKGYVWIAGRGKDDDQIPQVHEYRKVRHADRSLSESKGNTDTANAQLPADVTVYSKTNEVFVADGYGNRRVIVFDAEKVIQRMWGAFATCRPIPKNGTYQRLERYCGHDNSFSQMIWKVRKP